MFFRHAYRLSKTFWNCHSVFMHKQNSSIRIGCASGFWGDTATSVPALLNHGKLDFLVFDYLSEITMSLLAAAKQKSPDMGYTPDFVLSAMAPNMQSIKKQNIKVISNAGGINPHACANALKELSKKLDLNFKIAVVTGDDLLSQEEEIRNTDITDMKKGFHFPKHVQSINAYLGAGPIAKALDGGADIVITGRCVDSALVLGPLVSTFHWSLDNWDKLAAGSLAGHLIECGSQSTGGIHTDWHLVPDWHEIGFPIVECESSGKFIISKPSNTGGRVSVGTVAEQLLYEIDDPENYHLPDVTCDFSNVTLHEISDNVIEVDGAKGKMPSNFYKVSATFLDGFRATAVCPVMGPQAVDKAHKTAESILKRTQLLLNHLGMGKFIRTHLEVLGSEQCYGKNANAEVMISREVVMWLAVHHEQRAAVKLFTQELAAAATGGAPGLTTLVGGRPKVSPIFKLFSFLYPKNKIMIQITSNGKTEDYFPPSQLDNKTASHHNIQHCSFKQQNILHGSKTYCLSELAYIRSGDKGNTCNIGVAARHPSFLPYIEKQLTADAVSMHFDHVFEEKPGIVKRYFLPGIHAFNFVLEDSLGGGGVASLKSDPQGKAYGQILSDFILKDMPSMDLLK